MTVNVFHAAGITCGNVKEAGVAWREYELMNAKHFYFSVAMAFAVVIYTGSVVLSASLTPISQTSQSEGKGGKHEPCTEVSTRADGV